MSAATPADFWNERYAAPGYAYGTEPNDFLAAQAAHLAGKGAALCLAEGEGRNAVWLARRGYAVTAVDLSEVGLRKAASLAERHERTIQTVIADLADFLIAPAHWDVIVSIWCHVPPATRADLHRRVVEGLKPGGWFILEAYTPAQTKRATGGPRDPQLCMSLADLRRELAGLEIRIAHEILRPIHEGPHHTGDGDVVQLFAQKP